MTRCCINACSAVDARFSADTAGTSPRAGRDAIIALLHQIDAAVDPAQVVDLMRPAAQALGAESACFICWLQDRGAQGTYRLLMACDPLWSSAYLRHRWYRFDPWLAHARRSEAVRRGSDIAIHDPSAEDLRCCSLEHGFRDLVVVPAPTPLGGQRYGVLYLGHPEPDALVGAADPGYRTLARGLAFELQAWCVDKARRAALGQASFSDTDLMLLRLQDAGSTTKQIARAIGQGTSAVDSRFQRINAKLRTTSKRESVRLARVYGLI